MAEKGDPKGLYGELGVSFDANSDDIRKAYRRLALRWHPDKNQDDPSATAKFQKISAAYEVLSDTERRQMYDETGCVDADELDGDDAADIFASFFRNFDEDLDADEMFMFDEFLQFAGGDPFRRKHRRGAAGGVGLGSSRHKKGRAARESRGTRGSSSDRAMEKEMEMFMAAAMGSSSSSVATPEPCCDAGHPLKRRKADEEYECDVCKHDIAVGKRFFDCRTCDFSVCQKCQKKRDKEALLELEEEADIDPADVIEAFCEMATKPVRSGARLKYKCELCSEVLAQEAVAHHMEKKHSEELECFCDQALGGMDMDDDGLPDLARMGGMGMEDMSNPLEMLFMMGAMDDMMGSGGPKAKGSSQRHRKKR